MKPSHRDEVVAPRAVKGPPHAEREEYFEEGSFPMDVFDPDQEVGVILRRLPHWSQPGTITFITWRTWDSLPERVIRQWQSEGDAWLKKRGIDPSAPDWQNQLQRQDVSLVKEFKRILADRWNDHLDDCHGACVLRRPELSGIVADSLRHFDGDRYELTDFVVMPNHVHILAAFPCTEGLLAQCESWKHFTATKINRLLGRKGRLWQQDGFDHLVRSQEQFVYLRGYLANNPKKAKLKPDEYRVYSSRSA
jgi:type I restriction enzyme R subunit